MVAGMRGWKKMHTLYAYGAAQSERSYCGYSGNLRVDYFRQAKRKAGFRQRQSIAEEANRHFVIGDFQRS